MEHLQNREELRVGKDQETARVAAVKKASAWTMRQAARLEVMPKEISAATLRGWLPEDILAATSKYQLEGAPLCLEIREAIEKIKNAPILPVIDTRSRWASGRESWRQDKAKNTAMSEAFRMAAE